MEMPSKVIEDNDKRRVEAHRRPLGVVAAIIPWNFPILIIAFKMPLAVLAGNCIILKPAPTTPLTTLLFGELCAEIFPPGVLSVIADANDMGPVLTRHPDIRRYPSPGRRKPARKSRSEEHTSE